jgi:glycosyltransferase involved in cell wall biosynthesis
MENMDRPRVAFVVQRYGYEVNGGAETHCRIVAERMAPHWEIEVLTSRARDYVLRFENDYPEGVTQVGGLPVRRFTIGRLRSEPHVFSALDRKVLARRSSVEEDRGWLREIGPDCPGLMEYLRLHESQFHAVVFFTYLYATTTRALPLVSRKALLVPTAHDEPPIHARPFDCFFQQPRLLLCNTPEEESFLRRRTGGAMAPSCVVGVGVAPESEVDPELFRARYGIPHHFVLCVGRIQREKGSDQLFRQYLALPVSSRQKYPLVLIGKAAMEIPVSPYIRHVGFVSEAEKQSALAGAMFVIAPSPFESLSLVLLEAWGQGTAALVNGDCDVLAQQVRRANGGLWYENEEEFAQAFGFLVDPQNLSVRRQLGQNGRAFVAAHYQWTRVIEQYRSALRSLQESKAPAIY